MERWKDNKADKKVEEVVEAKEAEEMILESEETIVEYEKMIVESEVTEVTEMTETAAMAVMKTPSLTMISSRLGERTTPLSGMRPGKNMLRIYLLGYWRTIRKSARRRFLISGTTGNWIKKQI